MRDVRRKLREREKVKGEELDQKHKKKQENNKDLTTNLTNYFLLTLKFLPLILI